MTTLTFLSLIAAVFVLALSSHTGEAATHISLSGSLTDSNAGLQKAQSGGAQASLSTDLGSYVRLGYTHRQQVSNSYGYLEKEEEQDPLRKYPEYSSKTHVISHSLDLTLILYAGDVFTPYIFGGPGLKTYKVETKEQYKELKVNNVTIPAYNAGLGLSIKLNQKFSLKMFHTVSPGVTQLPNKEAEGALDSYSQVGIEYSF